MDPSALTTDNIVATVVAGIGIGIYALWQYIKERKSPTTQTGDRIVPGLTIADMTPIRELAAEQARTTAANVRIAEALESLLELSKERAADEEIVRRAEIMAQQMLKQLPGGRPSRAPR